MVDLIGQYVRFPLPRHWGSEKTAIADGTHVKLGTAQEREISVR
jgi:hypothetical protein